MNIADLDRWAGSVIDVLWRSSWQAAVLALLVLAAQWVLRSRLSARWRHNLWLLVLLRLVVPITPASPWSVFNLAPRGDSTIALTAFDAIPVAPPLVLPDAPAEVEVAKARAMRAPPVRWKLLLVTIWLIGAALLLARIVIATARLIVSTRRMRDVDDEAVIALFDRCRAELNITRRIRLLVASDFPAPALMGVLRPKLLLSRNVIENFDSVELRLILLHELAHLKRHDVAINWLIAALQAFHWFNPLVWVAFARLRSDRELACDEMVLAAAADHATYGHTIVKLLESLPAVIDRRALSQAAAVGILERAHPMRRRITMIAQFPRRANQWSALAALCMIALAGFGLTDAVRGEDAVTAAATAPGRQQMVPSASTTRQATTPAEPFAARGAPLAPTTPEPGTVAGPAPTSEAEPLYQRYQMRVPELRFDGIPFIEVIEFLRDVTKNNIVVNWRALEAAGIDPSASVSLQLRDVSFEQVLRHLCSNVGGGTVRLGFTIDAGAFVLSTEESLASATRARAYNVVDLLERQPITAPVGLEQIEGGTLRLAAGSTAAPTTTPVTGKSELIELITEHIAPDSWRDAGGTLGTIRLYNGRLVVSTIDTYHLEIDKLLAELRRQ